MKIYSHYLGSLLFLLCFCSPTFADFEDYSGRGGEYTVLKDIRLAALKVDFVEIRRIEVLDQTYEASVFSVKTREVVPFVDTISEYNNVLKDLDVFYEFIVVKDVKHIIHDRLIEEIYALSLKTNGKQGDLSNMGIVGKNDSYLIYKGKSRMPDLIWFEGRSVQVKFKGFNERRRDRDATTETFWKDKIRFYSGNEKLPIESMKATFPGDFLRLYKEGKFRKHQR